jgi:hypothetical protein
MLRDTRLCVCARARVCVCVRVRAGDHANERETQTRQRKTREGGEHSGSEYVQLADLGMKAVDHTNRATIKNQRFLAHASHAK